MLLNHFSNGLLQKAYISEFIQEDLCIRKFTEWVILFLTNWPSPSYPCLSSPEKVYLLLFIHGLSA